MNCVRSWKWDREDWKPPELEDFEAGLIIGLLIGEVHFGGDQKQAQVTLRMRVRELPLLQWVHARLPAGKLYGPYSYTYKDGGTRTTYQLMYRGKALRDQLVPFLDTYDWKDLAPGVYARYAAMKERYQLVPSGSDR